MSIECITRSSNFLKKISVLFLLMLCEWLEKNSNGHAMLIPFVSQWEPYLELIRLLYVDLICIGLGSVVIFFYRYFILINVVLYEEEYIHSFTIISFIIISLQIYCFQWIIPFMGVVPHLWARLILMYPIRLICRQLII